MIWPMTHPIQLARGSSKYQKDSIYPGWGTEGPGPSSSCTGRGGKHDSNIVPFRATRLAAYTHLLLNVMRSKRFLSYLILTLSWRLKNKIRFRWEKFAPSYNPLFRVCQITILATARIARNTLRFSPRYGGITLSTT